jgi:hypothetical protein
MCGWMPAFIAIFRVETDQSLVSSSAQIITFLQLVTLLGSNVYHSRAD